MSQLRISEIFFSLQGESLTVGIPTTFIRLTGCPLRCGYCDTAYAFQGGTTYSIDAILTKVATINTRYITVTGGEPLAQPACLSLLQQLCDADYCVSLETSGALDISAVDSRVIKVMDIKTPGSGEVDRNRFANIEYLNQQDCHHEDYEWAKEIIATYGLYQRCVILFSPCHAKLANQNLAEWILQDQLPVRFQLQLHKYIWGDVPGH
jgi:7-carboxy-7-deazaguanine synthase